jgi:ribosome-binding factor A
MNMALDKEVVAQMRALCAEVCPEDGQPRRRNDRRPRRKNRKTHQLCGQIRRAIDLSLAASADPVLRELWVVAVSPAPDASRVRVQISTFDPELPPGIALAAVKAATGWLRSETAQAISRKKVPELCFGWETPS